MGPRGDLETQDTGCKRSYKTAISVLTTEAPVRKPRHCGTTETMHALLHGHHGMRTQCSMDIMPHIQVGRAVTCSTHTCISDTKSGLLGARHRIKQEKARVIYVRPIQTTLHSPFSVERSVHDCPRAESLALTAVISSPAAWKATSIAQ